MKLNTRGMTLVEALVSTFIIALVFFGLIRLHYFGKYQINISRHKMMAVNLAQAELENLFNTGYGNVITTDYPLTQTVVIDPGLTDSATDDLNGTMTTQLVNLNVNEGYKFIISVVWADYYGQMTEVTETLLTPYEQ